MSKLKIIYILTYMIFSTIIGKETYLIYHYIMAATTKNRNGTSKLIEYNQGHQCIVPTNKLYWRKTKDKYKRIGSRNTNRVYWTRYMTWANRSDLFKNKGNFEHMSKTPMHYDYDF